MLYWGDFLDLQAEGMAYSRRDPKLDLSMMLLVLCSE